LMAVIGTALPFSVKESWNVLSVAPIT